MARTESKSTQVHPADEQNMIDVMQRFHWNLQSSQEIKTKDSHLERRGDKIYSVTETEHYVKLVFTRDLDTPNLDRLRELENEYFSMQFPSKPGVIAPIPVSVIGGLIIGAIVEQIAGSFVAWTILILCWVGGFFWLKKNINRRREIDQIIENNLKRRAEILNECDKL